MTSDSDEEIRAYFVDNRDTYLIGDFLIGIAMVFLFLPFAACARSVFAQAEGEPGVATTIFFIGAILIVAVGFVGGIAWGTLAMGAKDEAFDDSNVKMLMYMGEYAFSGIALGFALAALGGSAVILTTAVVARWAGYLGLAAVVLNIVGSAWIIDGDSEGVLAILGLIGMLVFAVWILSLSVLMLRQKQPEAVAMEPAAV